MGSGVTTTFMAHTIKNTTRNENEKNSQQTELARYVDPSDDDLPKRIVCFEHNRAKYTELTASLKKSGLAPVVGLEFAPLVPDNHNGQEHLFYDCASRLQHIAKLLEGRQARIFILVNRATGGSQPEALVALPQVLSTYRAILLISWFTPKAEQSYPSNGKACWSSEDWNTKRLPTLALGVYSDLLLTLRMEHETG